MAFIRDRLNSFSAVAAGSTANVNVPVGPTYREFWLNCDAAVADIERIVVRLNTDPIVDVNAQDLLDLEKHKHGAAASNWYRIPFADTALLQEDGQRMSELVTGPGDNLSVEVTIAGGATITKLEGWYLATEARPRREFIPRLMKLSWVPGATGEQEFTTLPRGPRYRRMLIGGDTGEHDQVSITRDLVEIFDTTTAFNDDVVNAQQGLTTPGGTKHVYDFLAHGYVSGMLVTQSQSMVLTADVTTAGKMPIVLETLEADGTVFQSRQNNGNSGGAGRRRNRQGNGGNGNG